MRMITTLLRTMLLLLLLSTLGACNSEYNSSHQSEGDALVAKLHQAVQQRHWDDLKSVYSGAYLTQNTIGMLQDHWQQLIKKYGNLKGFRLRSKQKDARLQGEFYIYNYAVLFDNAIVRETITVFRSGQDQSITVSGHRLIEGD